MLKIVDCERLQDDRFKVLVETDDSSLFALLTIFESLVEFTGFFRYQTKIALRISDNRQNVERMYELARADREKMLALYESLEGDTKEKQHKIWAEWKKGREWINLQDVQAMLTIARKERKENQGGKNAA